MFLEETGLVVDTAVDGNIAVEMTARNDYALILMDMQMPTMDGLEATHLTTTSSGRNVQLLLPILWPCRICLAEGSISTLRNLLAQNRQGIGVAAHREVGTVFLGAFRHHLTARENFTA